MSIWGHFWAILADFGLFLVPFSANFGVFAHNSGHVWVSRLTWGVHSLPPGPFQHISAAQRFPSRVLGHFGIVGVFDQNTFPVHFGLDL